MAEQPNADTTEIEGRYGKAIRLVVPSGQPQSATTVCAWLIESRHFSPAWNQWMLSILSLADTPGMPPANRHFEAASHELLVFALNPEHGPYSQATLDAGQPFPHLLPINYCDQFEGSDIEMTALAAWMVWGVVNGHLELEPGSRMDRESWLTSAVKTLAHIRGEEHAP